VLPTTAGGLYTSDIDANVIRFIDAGGTIRTVAGDGRRGYAGDGGPATQAALNAPTRMRIGPDGALYFCDTDNHVIRRLDQAGVVTTVAGTGIPGYSGDAGPALQAQFNEPYDLRFAANGDLYVADTQNHVIRRIDASGVVNTVVGTGEGGFAGDGAVASGCRLNRPAALAFAADGSLWIADTFNQRVRRVAGFLGQ
jgi:serine/threonine-protein kinase